MLWPDRECGSTGGSDGGQTASLEALHPWQRALRRARYAYAKPLILPGAILDDGCGRGEGISWLTGQGSPTCVCAIDASHTAIDAARAGADKADEINFLVANALDLPFSEDTFDNVLCFEVIEHVRQPLRLLEEVDRVLAPGGRAFLSTPNGLRNFGNPLHVSPFTPREFEAAIAQRWSDYRILGLRPATIPLSLSMHILRLGMYLKTTFRLRRGRSLVPRAVLGGAGTNASIPLGQQQFDCRGVSFSRDALASCECLYSVITKRQ